MSVDLAQAGWDLKAPCESPNALSFYHIISLNSLQSDLSISKMDPYEVGNGGYAEIYVYYHTVATQEAFAAAVIG